MRLLFAMLASLLVTFEANSQVQFNVFGGPQITSSLYTILNVKQEQTPKYGFNAGMGMKVPFEGNLYFAPAAFYSLKGYKVKYNLFRYPPDNTATDNNTTFHTFELAAMLQYDLSSKTDHFYVKIGPSLDFQLFGKEKYHITNGSTPTLVERDIPFGYDKYGHYNANMLMQFGYEFQSGLFLFGQYSHGMGSVNNTDGGPKIRHRVYGISLGKYL